MRTLFLFMMILFMMNRFFTHINKFLTNTPPKKICQHNAIGKFNANFAATLRSPDFPDVQTKPWQSDSLPDTSGIQS